MNQEEWLQQQITWLAEAMGKMTHEIVELQKEVKELQREECEEQIVKDMKKDEESFSTCSASFDWNKEFKKGQKEELEVILNFTNMGGLDILSKYKCIHDYCEKRLKELD